MSVMNAKATEIVTVLAVEEEAKGPLIDIIIQLLPTLLPLLLNCIPKAKRNAAGLAEALKAPNLRQRLGLRFAIRKNIDDPRTGNLTAPQLETAFWQVAATINETEAAALMAEVA